MFTTEEREVLLQYADIWYGDTTKCITEDTICGKSSKTAYKQLFKVYYLRKLIDYPGALTEHQIDMLYQRLNCLINLTIEE